MTARLLLPLALLFISPLSSAQVLTEWVESNPANEPDKIELGYPTPIPVDTPMPFDGFRTYAGLHARHQDLAATTPYVHPVEIGQTRMGRTIWAYRLGDEDFETVDGLPEPATLTNGGIHAREWQSPEVVTGILELMAAHENDHYFYDYLRDNVNMIVIPSLNIDGFLQTQRFPRTNYLQTDISFPATSPRDGRMRRKNMLGVDEDLLTIGDHLFGVDLNRNNPPFWATNPNRSSPDSRSIVHHGAGPHSEPETQALDAAAHLGPIEQLRLYTDVHSFSQVHFWGRNSNNRLSALTEDVLNLFTTHHQSFPAGKFYFFSDAANTEINTGIGATDGFFTHTYQVPSWTLEVEPSFGNHPGLPGGGADYGGSHVNGHDGFILPDSEIRRVREELAQSFAAVYYRQAGPPNIQEMQFIDIETGATVFEAEWDFVDERTRSLFTNQIQPLQLDRDYIFRVAYNKPMRWRENGDVVPFPGQSPDLLNSTNAFTFSTQTLSADVSSEDWQNQPGGYRFYEDDTVNFDLNFPRDPNNEALINGTVNALIGHLLRDMTGMYLDADPSTVAYWEGGHWNDYENQFGGDQDTGGLDQTISVAMTDEDLGPPFTIEPGIAAAWGDVDRDGEGFLIEILANGLAVMFWFTYDDDGHQDWYIAVGHVQGNRIVFPRLLHVSGGVFGPDFDPALISEEVVGSASFIWSDCGHGSMDWKIGSRAGRQNLARLTTIMGLDCGPPILPPITEQALFSGSWGDPTHDGEGYAVEVLADGRALVFWFSFGPDGKRRWYFGIGSFIDGVLVIDNMLTTTGGFFAENLDPENVEEVHWGTLEMDLSCEGGTADYTSVEDGFPAGRQNVGKITNMTGLDCTP